MEGVHSIFSKWLHVSLALLPPRALWTLPHAFFKLLISTFSGFSSFPGKPRNGQVGDAHFVDMGVE